LVLGISSIDAPIEMIKNIAIEIAAVLLFRICIFYSPLSLCSGLNPEFANKVMPKSPKKRLF
jgi:hypothetical protein